MRTLTTRLASATIFGVSILSSPAYADLTADDVWQHFQQSSSVFGGTLNGQKSESDDGLALQKVVFDLPLPFDFGTVQMDLGAFDLRNMGDGRVEMIVPESAVYNLTYTDTDGESFDGSMTMTQQGLSNILSGTPEEITFDQKADRLDFKFDISDLPADLQRVTMNGSIVGFEGQSVTSRADMNTTNVIYAFQEQSMTMTQTMAIEGEDPITVEAITTSGRVEGDTRLVTPSAGINLANLAKALRDGFVLEGTNSIAGYSSKQVSSQNDTVVMAQTSSAASYETTMKVDASGAMISGPASDVQIQMEMPMMPGLPLGGKIASVSATVQAPLLKDDGFGPAAVSFELTGLELDEMLWAMGDPAGALPHDPVDLKIDLSGTLKNNIEWLDFANVETSFDALGEMLPVEPGSATLNALRVSAVGAEITGEGAFTFDSSDLETFEGLPRPEGKLTLRAKGLTVLSQKLEQLGIPAEQIYGAMMMLEMFSVEDTENGDDARMTEVEVKADGGVFANGVQLQ
ncbi:hypothetical protein SAMN04488030_2428 [Aliiroseovarius halocynthiae]|uniref:DUF2125 domain-containing protein n=1 Tax=Aliiroseovarius halocynthiae TaxID=985055 RepID=A0A545SQD7_9RHOB|nr:hypothetical protein [Aliiroseovarius halocynthiae]TQV67183.1 hypothetical protein FIL88_11415 [Aliiroseovarius halocynthiae]SMR82086.1 hypothetical protein SAMN04488030_2428 [Aliiroseovarius halocynthiae]